MHAWLKPLCAVLASGLACLVGAEAPAASVTVEYAVRALAGSARYEYTYTLDNVSLAPSLGWFSVDFDPVLFDEGSLTIVSPGPGSGWSEQLLASVPGLPAQYDAYKAFGARLAIGESATGFKVQATWLGSGVPGTQVYTVWDPTTLAVVETGVTVPIPEPGRAALALMGLGGVAAAARRARRFDG